MRTQSRRFLAVSLVMFVGIVTVNCPPLLAGAAGTGIQFAGNKFVVLSSVQSFAQPGQFNVS